MKLLVLGFIGLLLVTSVGCCQETNQSSKVMEKGISKIQDMSVEGLAVSVVSIDIPKEKDGFFVIHVTLENKGKEAIVGVIQSSARCIVKLDNIFYAEKDFGGKSSWMPPGRRYDFAIDTETFRQIKKAEIYPFIEATANKLEIQSGEHKISIFYKLDNRLVPSQELTINVP